MLSDPRSSAIHTHCRRETVKPSNIQGNERTRQHVESGSLSVFDQPAITQKGNSLLHAVAPEYRTRHHVIQVEAINRPPGPDTRFNLSLYASPEGAWPRAIEEFAISADKREIFRI
jgi:hypothetical protein